jgi:hypothetical protein
MSSPAGWYPQPDGQQRYWDGHQWTEDFAPGAAPVTTPENERVTGMSDQLTAAPQVVPVAVEIKGSNGLAVAGFVLALLGAMTSFIPVVNIFGGFLALLGLIFGIIGLVQSGKRRAGKGLSIAAIVLAVAAFVISFAVNAATVSVLDKAVKDVGTAAVTPKTGQSAPSDTSKSDSSFKAGVLTTPEMKIEIIDHKIIPVGKKGNEYGSKPVIAFWYKITNLSNSKVSPMDWMFTFEAYQDNNPNAENKLDESIMFDNGLKTSLTENIKKGGTVEYGSAYELDDVTTPVVLVASRGLGIGEVGRMTYNLK